MVDRQYEDVELAALYDLFCCPTGRADLAFYLPMVMEASSVLDVGCGTGALLDAAREAGHRGRLCGLDPAIGMMEQARRRTDVEWVVGDLGTATISGPFDLAVMTGHAFQVLVGDREIHDAFMAVGEALSPDGRFAFETRNPLRREWEEWTADRIAGVTDEAGNVVLMRNQVDSVDGDVIGFTTTYESPGWDEVKVSRSVLRFLDNTTLVRALSSAGLAVEQQFGDWDRSPLTPESPEIITIALRS
jgi:SAM-dependent methyltransferase